MFSSELLLPVCGISLSEENEFRWIKNDVHTAPFSKYLLVHYSENKVYIHNFRNADTANHCYISVQHSHFFLCVK